jgi:hypothetical protein
VLDTNLNSGIPTRRGPSESGGSPACRPPRVRSLRGRPPVRRNYPARAALGAASRRQSALQSAAASASRALRDRRARSCAEATGERAGGGLKPTDWDPKSLSAARGAAPSRQPSFPGWALASDSETAGSRPPNCTDGGGRLRRAGSRRRSARGFPRTAPRFITNTYKSEQPAAGAGRAGSLAVGRVGSLGSRIYAATSRLPRHDAHESERQDSRTNPSAKCSRRRHVWAGARGHVAALHPTCAQAIDSRL